MAKCKVCGQKTDSYLESNTDGIICHDCLEIMNERTIVLTKNMIKNAVESGHITKVKGSYYLRYPDIKVKEDQYVKTKSKKRSKKEE